MENSLKKLIWTEKDFNQMKWHDCSIYAFAFDKNNYKLMFDIDYIFKWIEPEKKYGYYKFLVSPATLVFENVYDLQIDIESDLEIEIDNIYIEGEKEPNNKDYIKKNLEWKWVIDTQQGRISFWSVGFNMYIRQQPLLQQSQKIQFDKRGGVSFKMF